MRRAKIKMTNKTEYGKKVWQLEFSNTSYGNMKWYYHFGKQVLKINYQVFTTRYLLKQNKNI